MDRSPPHKPRQPQPDGPNPMQAEPGIWIPFFSRRREARRADEAKARRDERGGVRPDPQREGPNPMLRQRF